MTGTRKAALSVSAAASSTTTSVVRFTLVDICVITYQLSQCKSVSEKIEKYCSDVKEIKARVSAFKEHRQQYGWPYLLVYDY